MPRCGCPRVRPAGRAYLKDSLWQPAHPLLTDIEYDDTTNEGDLYEIDGRLVGALAAWIRAPMRPRSTMAGYCGRSSCRPARRAHGFIDQIRRLAGTARSAQGTDRNLTSLPLRYRQLAAKFGQRADRLIRLSAKMTWPASIRRYAPVSSTRWSTPRPRPAGRCSHLAWWAMRSKDGEMKRAIAGCAR